MPIQDANNKENGKSHLKSVFTCKFQTYAISVPKAQVDNNESS